MAQGTDSKINNKGDQDIAIVGMSCRLPGGINSPAQFWQFLCEGRNASGIFPEHRFALSPWFDADKGVEGKTYTLQGHFFDQLAGFDPLFFGISGAEAGEMDPMHQLVHTCSWQALENAGIVMEKGRKLPGGIFMGLSQDDFANIVNNADNLSAIGRYGLLGSNHGVAVGRIAYSLGLTGPAIAMDSTCSSSLVALQLAVNSLRQHQVDFAVAGGANLMQSPQNLILRSQLEVLSPTGQCKTFSNAADGYGVGEGVGAVVLKRLTDAQRDKDNILAVIKAAETGQNGGGNGLQAPNGKAQQQLIEQTIARSGLVASDIDYVETHGTGTKLGDPVELKAIAQTYGKRADDGQDLLLGAVKANIGHLESGAGILGLIKVVLSLTHKQLPPQPPMGELNQHVPWHKYAMKVVAEPQSWPDTGRAATAAVSSFGINGTNAHAIIQQYQAEQPEPADTSASHYVLPLSVKQTGQADRYIADWISRLRDEQYSLAALCATAACARVHYKHRVALTVSNEDASRQALIDQLQALSTDDFVEATDGKAILMFGGQGSQRAAMGEQLYQAFPVFAAVIDRCDAFYRTQRDHSLIELMFNDKGRLNQTLYAQPAIFAFEYALGTLMLAFGVTPKAVLGHSIGEFAAMCLAEMLTLDDAMTLVLTRADAMHQAIADESQSSGAMLAVGCGLDRIRQPLAQQWPEIAVAAINSPESITLSGDPAALKAIKAWCQEQQINAIPLNVEGAFHSSFMHSAREAVLVAGRNVTVSEGRFPVISTLTGQVITASDIGEDYWARQLCEPVNFADAVASAVQQGSARQTPVVIEISPKRSLPRYINECAQAMDLAVEVIAPQPRMAELSVLMQTCGSLFSCNLISDWQSLVHYWGSPAKVITPNQPLNEVPFLSERYQFSQSQAATVSESPSVNDRETDAMNAFFEPNQSVQTPNNVRVERLTQLVADLLKCAPHDVDTSASFLALGADSFTLVSLRRQIQDEFGVELDIRDMFEHYDTVTKLAQCLSGSPLEDTLPETSNDDQIAIPEQYFSNNPALDNRPVVDTVADMLATLLRCTRQDIDPQASFPALGADSFTLVSLRQRLQQQFDVDIDIRDMFEQYDSVVRIADYLATQVAPSQLAASIPATMDDALSVSTSTPTMPPVTSYQPQPASTGSTGVDTGFVPPSFSTSTPVSATAKATATASRLTPEQQGYMDQFVAQYNRQTAASKKAATDWRQKLCNNRRSSSGFRLETKEMNYPIVVSQAKGSQLWDVDGNAYVDLAMGWGSTLFGHRPEFVQRTMEAQLNKGFAVGPESEYAGECAELMTELTGSERALFVNSGTEAVMTAIRIARAATKREKIAIFHNSYHGHSDASLIVPDLSGEPGKAAAQVPGIPESILKDVILLPYDSSQSLELIRQHAHELAAVLVEPVQSRFPDRQPKAFLQSVQQLTRAHQIALVMDEILVGFRVNAGGTNKLFGIDPDISLFGKVVGGGMPIGVVTGKAWCLDLVDGGQWQYGDTSMPDEYTTYTAGTFCKHPLTMTVVREVLTQIKQQGHALYERLNGRTDRLMSILRQVFEHHQVPLKVVNFGSFFRFSQGANLSFTYQPLELDIFFYHLQMEGIYLTEGRTCFLSVAHTDADMDKIVQAANTAIIRMKQAGFWQGHSGPGKSSTPVSTLTKPNLPAASQLKTAPQLQKASPVNADVQHAAEQRIMQPITTEQQHLMMLDDVNDGGMYTNTMTVALTVKGRLNSEWLQQAYATVTTQHEALRTVLDRQANTQITEPASRFISRLSIEQHDVSSDPQGLETLLNNEAHRLFELDKVLHRILFVQDGSQQHLVFSVSHLVCDGVGLGILIQDLAELYNRAAAGQVLTPQPRAGMSELLNWRENQMKQTGMQAQKAFWLNAIEQSNHVELHTDNVRGALRTFNGATCVHYIGADAISKLHNFARHRKLTHFMVSLTAYVVLLNKMSGQQTITVGVPFHGRTMPGSIGKPGSETTIGSCANIYPLVIKLDEQDKMSDILRHVQGQLLQAFEHQDLPFSDLITDHLTDHDPSRSAFFSVVFNWDKLDLPSFNGVQSRITPVKKHYINHDISFDITDCDQDLILNIDYNSDLFTAETIASFATAYETVLHQVVADVDNPVSAIALASVEQQQTLMTDISGTDKPLVETTGLDALFEQQVSRTPEKTALVFEGVAWTFDALNQRINQFAHYLIAQGVKPGNIVGLCVPRDAELVVAIYAIWKVGAAYVPIDYEQPVARVHDLLHEARVDYVLSHEMADISYPSDMTVIVQQHESITAFSTDNPALMSLEACRLAYVLFTSGSTGKPKGVMVAHSGLINMWQHLFDQFEQLGVSRNGVRAWNASHFFDTSVECLVDLCHETTLHLIPKSLRLDIPALLDYCQQHQITVMDATPSEVTTLLDCAQRQYTGSQTLPSLIIGGEAINPDLWNRLADHFDGSDRRAINTYGITECSVNSTLTAIMPGSVPSIGRPFANVRCYVLDRHGQPVPAGIPGELYIGGVSVTEGYLGNSELTLQRFVPDPFSGNASGRLFRTGDKVRWKNDGNLDFINRIDAQIKVRGFRIEPGEIEAQMLSHDGVKDAVIKVCDINGMNTLVAYLVPDVPGNSLVASLRTWLMSRLPEYMMPAHYVELDELPLNRSGKTDMAALPLPDISVTAEARIEAPANELEQRLVAIWQDVLNLDSVCVLSSFFDIGGNSLLASRVAVAISEAFAIRFSVKFLFMAKTIRGLAEHITELVAMQQPEPTPVQSEQTLDTATEEGVF